MEPYYDQLKRAMKSKGHTIKTLAENSDFDASSICRATTGKNIRFSTLERLASIFDLVVVLKDDNGHIYESLAEANKLHKYKLKHIANDLGLSNVTVRKAISDMRMVTSYVVERIAAYFCAEIQLINKYKSQNR